MLGEKNNAGVIKTVPNQHYLSIQQYREFYKKVSLGYLWALGLDR